jgi:hypothetical protein
LWVEHVDGVVANALDQHAEALLAVTQPVLGFALMANIARDLAKPINSPLPSHTGSMTTLVQNCMPSLRTRQPSASNLPSSAAMRSACSGKPAARSASV